VWLYTTRRYSRSDCWSQIHSFFLPDISFYFRRWLVYYSTPYDVQITFIIFTSFYQAESSFGTSTWYRFWTSISLNHFQSNSSILHFMRCSLAYGTPSLPQDSAECRSQLYRRITHQWHLNLWRLKTLSICLPIGRSSSVFVYTLWCGNIVILAIPLLEVENLQLAHHQRYIRRDIPAKLPVWKVLSLSPCFNI
jgi:hypothetical protein